MLFSGCRGYVRCLVVPGKREGQKPYAFVQFDSPDNAAHATEARQNTTWEEGGPAISIEAARRDIPEHFSGRQEGVRPALGLVGPSQPLPAKRPRYEGDAGHGADVWAGGELRQDVWEGDAGHGAGVQTSALMPPSHFGETFRQADAQSAQQQGPRTLHVGGLPPGILQEDLDAFLHANFGEGILGSKLSADNGKGKAWGLGNCLGRAFVGFTSHAVAVEAQSLLQGFNWDGAVLHAEWARTEFKFGPPGGGPSPAKGAPAPLQFARPGKGSGTAVGPPAAQLWGAAASPLETGAKRTLHFTNLPAISEDEFHNFIAGTFPDQVTSARFKETHDGRPPVAWVLFVDDFVAAQVAKTHLSFEWHDMQVAVQFARSELDPSKVRGARSTDVLNF